MLVDTGSTGLRLLSALVAPSLALRQQTDSSDNPLVECGQFASGFTWGPVQLADVRIAQELARATPIQLIANPAFAAVPASCSDIGAALDNAAPLGATGVLGLGVFQQDCGTLCAQNIVAGTGHPRRWGSVRCFLGPYSLRQVRRCVCTGAIELR